MCGHSDAFSGSCSCLWTKSRYHGPLFPGRTSYPLSKPHNGLELDVAKELDKPDHQLNQIFMVIGTPTTQECAKITDKELRTCLLKMKTRSRCDFKKKFSFAPAAAVLIASSMLQFDPSQRVKVSSLLVHPYFKEVVYPKRMYGAKGMKFPFEDDPHATTANKEKDRLRKLIVQEARLTNQRADQEAAAKAKKS